jgi:hypothetical protein
MRKSFGFRSGTVVPVSRLPVKSSTGSQVNGKATYQGLTCNITSAVKIVPMKANEIPIVAGPRSEYMEVLVSALNEDSIPARIVMIADVEPPNRPEWACTPGDEVYVVVPRDKREIALELTQWVLPSLQRM